MCHEKHSLYRLRAIVYDIDRFTKNRLLLQTTHKVFEHL